MSGSFDPDMKRETITIPVTLLTADVTQMSQKDQLKARSEGLFFVTDDDRKKPCAWSNSSRQSMQSRAPLRGCWARYDKTKALYRGPIGEADLHR